MPLFRTRLHLPTRSPGPGATPAGPAAPEPSAVGPARIIVDATAEPGAGDPIPLLPVPVRQATPPDPPAPRARRSKPAREAVAPTPPPAPVPAPIGLLPDDPAVPETVDRPLRLVLVEEVPEVAAHVREMLRSQPSVRLLEVVADSRQVVHEVSELRADVVMVDTHLRGHESGIDILDRLRSTSPGTAVVALGIPPDDGLARRVRAAADAVVSIPFGTIDLARGIRDAHDSSIRRDPSKASRMVAVYAAKGGVGKTTLALNLAVGLAATGVRTALVDGSLQYGDMRRLLHVDVSEPSICDLPTDCVRSSDLVATMRRGPAGVDILFAPPRLEMADTVTARDLDKILDLLRRSYRAVVVDTPCALNDTTLTILDMADVILQVLTPESAALDSTRAAAAAFAAIGYPATKVRVVINRADALGGLRPDQLRRALGHEPDHVVASDWQLVSASNQDGIPFVVANPGAQISRDVMALASAMMSIGGTTPSRLPVRVRSRARGGARAAG